MFNIFFDGFKHVCNIIALGKYQLKQRNKDKVELHRRDSGIFIIGFGQKLSLGELLRFLSVTSRKIDKIFVNLDLSCFQSGGASFTEILK